MIIVRPYRSSDLSAVVALWHEAKRHAFPYVDVQQRYTLADDDRYFQDYLLTECSILVAGQQEEVAGFMALKPGYIDQLFVRVGWQRQGIGSALINNAKQLVRAELHLYTYRKNHAARAFYERHGFSAIAYARSPPPENEPDVEYHWSRISGGG